MTALLALNGERVISAQLTIARKGAAVADILLATSKPVPVASELAIGALKLKGRAVRMAPFAGARSVRFVGGGGGWRKTIKARGYSHDAGVRLSTVLGDAARDAGEQVSVTQDRVLGTAYVRERAVAERVLRFLAPQWWIDPDGVTQLAARASGLITSPFTVENLSGGKGRFEIATEAYHDWQPGRRFTSPTVAGEQTISTVQMTADNDGKLRLVVMTGEASEDRLLDSLRAIVRAESPSLTYSGIWEYTIESGTTSTVDATPTDERMPAIANCPMTPGLLGEGVTPTPGSKCRVQFVNADPTRPEVVQIIGTPVLVKIDASTLVKLGAGVLPVIVAGNFAGPFPCIPTQVKVTA